MSNVIKAYSVRYNEGAKKTIDTHLKDLAIEINKNQIKQTNAVINQQDGFVSGLKAVVVESISEDTDKNDNDVQITKDATLEADRIIEQAKREAQRIKDEALANAQKKGYEDGMLKVKEEEKKLKAEYALQLQKLSEERESLYNTLEPQIADIIAELVEKITGLLIEDKDEVILYLVEKAVRNLDRCDEITIKVSSEDYKYVSLRKDILLSAVGREITIYINEDPTLLKNQCFIETETKVINCSLDIQLHSLLTDIKLIGSI